MPRLEPIGRIEEDERDFEPLTIPVVGYRADTGEEVVTEIRFRPVIPLGAGRDVIVATDAQGRVPVKLALEFLDDALWHEDRAVWEELLHDPELLIEQTTMIEMYRQAMSWYAKRPTRQRSDSSPSSSTPRRTSRAAAPSRKSTSTRSRSGKPSTSRTRSR